LFTKFIKSALWGVAVRLAYILDAWCLNVNEAYRSFKGKKELMKNVTVLGGAYFIRQYNTLVTAFILHRICAVR